jgi:hypothetical protein
MEYLRCEQLGIPVHMEPVAHVFVDDVDKGLLAAAHGEEWVGVALSASFSALFGVQTAPVVDGGRALYPWDTEAVLERMMSGMKTGSQLLWD